MQQAYLQEVSPHQYDSMLIVHALKLPTWGTYTHARAHTHTYIHTYINTYMYTQVHRPKIPTPLLSGLY